MCNKNTSNTAIPIPKVGCHVRKADNLVQYSVTINGDRIQCLIGKATSDGYMKPNENFKIYFPDEFERYFPQAPEPIANHVHCGLFACFLAVAEKLGLYYSVLKAYGIEYGHVMMDFAMSMLLTQENNALSFEESMPHQIVFSDKVWSDAYISDFFANKVTDQEHSKFQETWFATYAENHKYSWLILDTSDSDCVLKNSLLAETGHAKSHQEFPNVSYMALVDAETGMPITWTLHNGGLPDVRAVDEIMAKASSEKRLNIAGVIADSAFNSKGFMDGLRNMEIPFVIKLKNNCFGYQFMLDKYGQKIKCNPDFSFRKNVFGVTDFAPIFKPEDETKDLNDCLGIFFDSKIGHKEESEFYEDFHAVRLSIKAQINQDPFEVIVPKEYEKFFKLLQNDDGRVVDVKVLTDQVREYLANKGYAVIASSSPMGAEKLFHLYSLRDSAEKLFATLKSQLGLDSFRVQSDQSIRGRFTATMIAAIVRNEFHTVAEQYGLSTNEFIRLMDCASLSTVHNKCTSVFHVSSQLKKAFQALGLTHHHFIALAQDVNDRLAGKNVATCRRIPDLVISHSKPGRPKGSKNKTTLEREKQQELNCVDGIEETAKRGPGRPKGSKNKKTLEREAQEREWLLSINAVKRGPGRPKGSKNKKNLKKEAQEQALILESNSVKPVES